jgi:hypothetical protein
MDLTLRPMSTSQVLDRTFSLYKSNFLLFAGIAALPPALKLGLDLLQLLLAFSEKTRATTGIAAASAFGVLVLAIAYLAGAVLASAASVYAVSMVHLGKPTTIGSSYKTISPYFWRLLGVGLLIGLMLLGIALVVAIPFIFSMVLSGTMQVVAGVVAALVAIVGLLLLVHVYARFSLAVAACVLEKASVVNAIRRSGTLTKNATGRIWLVLLLTVVLTWALTFALVLPGGVIMVAVKHNGFLIGSLWVQCGEFIATTIATPILTISLVLIYYDLRVRKEAFDLQLMMEAVGQPAPPQAFAAPSSIQ